jgi:hypothetical protein
MTVFSGRVVNGVIVIDDGPLPEGAEVTVLVENDGETFDVTPEEEAMLLASIAQADRGEFVSAEEVLTELRDDK